MKKITSLLLICLIILGTSFGVSATSDYGIADFDGKLSLLKYINVFQSDPHDYNANVSRASFAIYTVRLLGKSEIGSGAQKIFSDVESQSKAEYAISQLYDMNIITGENGATFRPNDSITVAEASKILVSIMGYKPYAEAKGAYPTGYLMCAEKIGVLDGKTQSEYITYTDLINILYNSLHTAMFDINAINGNSAEYSADDEQTILSVYHKIKFKSDILYTVSGMSANAEYEYESGKINIGGEKYNYNGEKSELLGKSVTVYYREKNNVKTAEAIYENSDMNKTQTIFKQDLTSFDTYKNIIKYTDGGRDKTIKLTADTQLIYNGTPLGENVQKTVDSVKSGTFEAIDNNSDGAYEVVLINSQRNVFISGLNQSESIIYDKFLPKQPVDCTSDANRNVVFKNASGIAKFSDLSEDTLVSVFESKNCVTVYINGSAVLGSIEKYSQSSKSVTVGGNEYEFDDVFFDSEEFRADTGSYVELYLDMYGKVAYMRKTAQQDGWKYGYVIDAKIMKGLDGAVKIKLFEQGEGVCEIEVADNVKIDGVTVKQKDKVIPSLAYNGQYSDTLIRFKTKDSNGVRVINEIDTANVLSGEDEHNSLQVAQPVTNTRYRRMRFGPMITVNSKSYILNVPSNVKTAEDYKFSTVDVNEIETDVDYDFMSYKLDLDSGYDDVVICRDIKSDTVTRPIAVVDEILGVISDETEHEMLYCRHNGFAKEYIVADSVSLTGGGIKQGDIIRLGFNEKGEIAKYEKHYSYNSNKLASDVNEYSTGNIYTTNHRIIAGYAISFKDGVLKLGSDPQDPNSVFEIFPLGVISGTTNVTVCDSKTARKGLDIKSGTYRDAATYESSGKGDMIVVRTEQAAAYEIVIYK